MKKPPYKMKILGDAEDAVILSEEQEVFPTYRVLSSQIKVEYIEDSECKTDNIKVQRRSFRTYQRMLNLVKVLNVITNTP